VILEALLHRRERDVAERVIREVRDEIRVEDDPLARRKRRTGSGRFRTRAAALRVEAVTRSASGAMQAALVACLAVDVNPESRTHQTHFGTALNGML
jgi:hypothetical protein